MSEILPIKVSQLLFRNPVESQRVEFKASWDEHTTGAQVLKTICAFANDYQNLNGGYIVIGVQEKGSAAVLPPKGLSSEEIEHAQKWILGKCRGQFDPLYQPIMAPEVVMGSNVLVVWVPASEMRPYRAYSQRGDEYKYWVRLGTETIDVSRKKGLMREFMLQSSRIPWDDRRATGARLEDLRESSVREYLRDVDSGLLNEPDAMSLYRKMRISTKVNDHEIPKNVGLLFFASDPRNWFRGACIEVVKFVSDRAGNVQEERVFTGGLADQVRNCLRYLENLSGKHLQKRSDRSQVRGWVSYPLQALRETLVNAVYHRGFDVDQPEPTKVYLFPDRIEVTSYPGPVPGIQQEHLAQNAEVHSVPARNRRIGEFLKELGLAEGRLSGLPKVYKVMDENGSPEPRFFFDEGRTYFQAVLPAHPEYQALSALRDATHLRTLGETHEAFDRVEKAWNEAKDSAVLSSELIKLQGARGELDLAKDVYKAFVGVAPGFAVPHVTNVFAETLITHGEVQRALKLLRDTKLPVLGQDARDAGLVAWRAKNYKMAHGYFEQAGDAVWVDAYALLQFARTKMILASKAFKKRRRDSNKRLLLEARGLIERVLQLNTSTANRGWAYRELGRTLDRLRAPTYEVEEAYQKAMEQLPDEERFPKELADILSRREKHRDRVRKKS